MQPIHTMIPMPITASTVTPEGDGVSTIEFELLSSEAPQPGQFGMLYAFGIGEIPISFSALAPGYAACTIRAAGRVSSALQSLRRGDQLGYRGPFGRGWPLVEPGDHTVIIAGGLGIVPLRPVIQLLINTGRRGEVFYGARQPDDLLFSKAYPQWQEHLNLTVTVDTAPSEWTNQVGTILAQLDHVPPPQPQLKVLICGPDIMLRLVVRELLARGHDKQTLYISSERNMKCAVGHCGRCQWGPKMVCRDGPVFAVDEIEPLLFARGI